MHPRFFESIQRGLPAELDVLDAPGRLDYLADLERLFQPCQRTGIAAVNALLDDTNSQKGTDPAYTERLELTFARWLLTMHELSPLAVDVLQLFANVAPSPEVQKQLSILQALALPAAHEQRVARLLAEGDAQRLEALLDSLWRASPGSVEVARARLLLDLQTGTSSKTWLDRFPCPPPLREAWQRTVFLHYAQHGLAKEALTFWERLPQAGRNATTLYLAGDMYARLGQKREALACYGDSLRCNERQLPVRLRLHALASPLRVDASLTAKRRCVICLYSWNKAELLEKTLRSLAASRIGASPVFVLLNGCTDDSRERVLGLRSLFGNGQLQLVEMPINIGAPTARNWLLNLPEVRASDYVAFLDDDVTVPADWLEQYLVRMERNPEAGAVGCKVVGPAHDAGSPPLQYLYRMVSLAEPCLLKLSICAPMARDTGVYEFTRECMNVMGCLHLLRTSALEATGGFDIQFNPSQLDDIDHDLRLCLGGSKVLYCGEVTCVHHQNSGVGMTNAPTTGRWGNVLGNDVKLTYKHEAHRERLLAINREIHERLEPVNTEKAQTLGGE